MCMDPKSRVPNELKFRVPKKQAYQCSLGLAPLTFEAEWRKLRIENYLEEDLDCILCCCLEEVDCRWGLGDLV
jgi:hypothetical protein